MSRGYHPPQSTQSQSYKLCKLSIVNIQVFIEKVVTLTFEGLILLENGSSTALFKIQK